MRLQLLYALTIAGLLAGAASATTLQHMTLEQIATQAPVAIVAEVAAQPAVTTSDGRHELATVKVTHVMWGTDQAELQVMVPARALQVGMLRVANVVPGAPMLFAGSEVMLFLAPDAASGGFTVLGFNQGVLTVTAGQQVVLPGDSAATPLAEAMTRIRQMRLAAGSAGELQLDTP